MRPAFEKRFPGRDVVCWNEPDAFAAGIDRVVYLLALRPPREHWGRAERLRLIQGLGAGVDHLLPLRGLPAGVRVVNNRGMSAEPMAEFALALVLALVKRIPQLLEAQHERAWRPTLPPHVAGQTLGILGLGAIGQALAVKAAALGMRVLGTQRTPGSHPAVERMVTTDELLSESDVVVVLVPLTAETRGLLSAKRLARLRSSAYLVNLARGGIVDEAALAEMLDDGRLAGAAFDVFETEPLPEDSPLWTTPNLWITPHVAGGFPEILEEVVDRFAENVARLERGEEPHNVIDLQRGY